MESKGYLAALTLTIVFTFGFAYMMVEYDIEAVMGNWDKRRCEVPIMILGGIFKPKGDSRSSTEFAKDNFSYCTKSIVDEVLRMSFAPLVDVAKQAAATQGSMTGPMNNVRGMIGKGMKTFSSIIKELYRRFTIVYAHFVTVWQRLLFAMGRANAIAASIVYAGLSLSTFMLNTIDFTFNVIMIILGIMIALMIILWFLIGPLVASLVLPVIAILIAAGVGVGGMAGAFCVDPDALVILQDGSKKPLKEVRVGDVLAGDPGEPNRVTGVITADAKTTPLVIIDGIRMSESHRVFHNGTWVLAKNHPEAKPCLYLLPHLICLNTTQHKVVHSANGFPVIVGDWEEVTTEAGQKAWIDWVHMVLNGGKHKVSVYPTAVPLVSKTAQVYHREHGPVPIGSVKVGDWIRGNGDWTQVTGVYQGTLKTTATLPSEWMSDGVWIHKERFWTTARQGIQDEDQGQDVEGVFLITSDECIELGINGKVYCVRDFTELGASKVDSAYTMLHAYMNKK